MSAILGIAAFILALFAVGGFMEGNMSKVLRYGAGALAICALILIFGGSEPHGVSSGDCWIDWDGRSNAEVCD